MQDILQTATTAGLEWLGNFRVDLTRYMLAAPLAWLVICVALAIPLAGRKIRPEKPPARQMLIEFGASVRSVAVFSTVALSTFAMERTGWINPPEIHGAAGWAVAGALLIAMMIAHDAFFYWSHRLMHRPALFRVFHRRHHRSNNPTPFTAYSFDLAEAAVQAVFVPLWVLIVPTPWAVTGIFMLHQIARNVIGHCGYELFPARRDGRPLFDWLTSVTHHDLHHGEAGWNYGLYFTWWDRWMGTEHPEYHARYAAAVRKARRPAPAHAGELSREA
ncbi:MAG: sterol desaturase family protein [Alphaproteobacteria bacterium]|nr:sterol desaturase family protein [Alphaproteobacteria bacterium]